MSVWAIFPSARSVCDANHITALWHDKGYLVAIWRDSYAMAEYLDADYIEVGKYPGYYAAMNRLGRHVFCVDPECDWVACAADDIEPDPSNSARAIADSCSGHFYNSVELSYPPSRPKWTNKPLPWHGGSGKQADTYEYWSTFGVMQPTGDRFAGGSIDRICGSPWIGREFMRRMYQGTGAYCELYTHMFGDEELQCVAQKLGVLWQRPDLVHLHMHFMRDSRELTSNATKKHVPAHLREANTQEHWDKYQTLFNERKAAGFPGHEPIP